MSDTQPEQSRCIACAREMASGAVKCAQCGSFQNWRRHLQFSATVLSLVVAIISVSGLVVPLLVKTFQQETSAVKVTFRSATINSWESGGAAGADEVRVDAYGIRVRILVTNTGNKPGFVESAVVKLEGADGPIAEAVLRISSSHAVVKPGTFALIDVRSRLQVLEDEAFPFGMVSKNSPPSVDVQAARLIVNTIQHDLQEETLEIALPAGKWEVEL